MVEVKNKPVVPAQKQQQKKSISKYQIQCVQCKQVKKTTKSSLLRRIRRFGSDKVMREKYTCMKCRKK